MWYSRYRVVLTMRSWVGAKQGSKTHKRIIDTFNTIKPLPDGWKMTYTAPWCATTVSAAFHKRGYDKIFPMSANCVTMMEKAKKMGIWHENDAYVPLPGDAILYDWDDNGKGDCKGSPDHVGLVEKVTEKYITVIEGNMGSSSHVGRRTIAINSRYIRGFIVPKFKGNTYRAKFVYALEVIGFRAVGLKFKYALHGLPNTFSKAKAKDRRMDCAHYVSFALQSAGILKTGECIWLDDEIHGSGKKSLLDAEKKGLVTILYPKKTVKQYKSKLKRGDICGFKSKSSQHTMAFRWLSPKKNPYWFSGGGSDINAGKLFPRRKSGYDNDRIEILIRLTDKK